MEDPLKKSAFLCAYRDEENFANPSKWFYEARLKDFSGENFAQEAFASPIV
jgi:hypothetical protein